MRRTGRLSSLLAILTMMAMLTSLIPNHALAVSTHSVSVVPHVSSNYIFSQTSTAPILRIEESPVGAFTSSKQSITLTLTNAEWTNDSKAMIEGQTQTEDALSLSFTQESATVAVIELLPKDPRTPNTVACFQIPMICKVLNSGEARVSIDGIGNNENLTFATVAAPGTTLTAASERTISESITLDTLRLQENTLGSINHSFQFQLVLSGSSVWAQAPSSSDFSFEGGFSGDASSIHIQDPDPNTPQVLVVGFTPSRNPQERGTLLLKNLQVRTPSSAIGNDIKIQIVPLMSDDFKGQVTAQDLVVAKPAPVSSHDHDGPRESQALPSLEVLAAGDALPLLAGRYGVGDAPECNRVQDIIIREKTAGSWVPGRMTSIQLPNDAKIMGYTVVQADNIDLPATRIGGDTVALNVYRSCLTQNQNTLNMTHSKGGTSSDCMTLRLRLYLSVKADATGDISAKVFGPSMSNEGSALLAHLVPAGLISIEKTETVTRGFQRALPCITITEPCKGAWRSSKDIVLTLQDGVRFNGTPFFSVPKGDIIISRMQIKDQKLTLTVKSDSLQASVLKIGGCMVDAGSTCPEGSYAIRLGGNAVVENCGTDELLCQFPQDYVGAVNALTVVAPSTSPKEKESAVLFTIGEKHSKIGDKVTKRDVSPYINEKGQPMLSLRAVALALGIPEENIMWNNRECMAVIVNGDNPLQVRIGDNNLRTKNGDIPMDATAVIKDGRTMLDLEALSKAFNCEVQWDKGQRTILFQECISLPNFKK